MMTTATRRFYIAGSSFGKPVQTQKKRHSAVEPKIGHLKNVNRMKHRFLKVFIGDEMNAVLPAAAFNQQKLLPNGICAVFLAVALRLISIEINRSPLCVVTIG